MSEAALQLETLIKDLVTQTVLEHIGTSPPEPELIRIEDAAKIAKVDRSVIDELVRDAPTNGFPAVRLGKRTIRIDEPRLRRWIIAGGLNGVDQETR